jgi:hypothetical protein
MTLLASLLYFALLLNYCQAQDEQWASTTARTPGTDRHVAAQPPNRPPNGPPYGPNGPPFDSHYDPQFGALHDAPGGPPMGPPNGPPMDIPNKPPYGRVGPQDKPFYGPPPGPQDKPYYGPPQQPQNPPNGYGSGGRPGQRDVRLVGNEIPPAGAHDPRFQDPRFPGQRGPRFDTPREPHFNGPQDRRFGPPRDGRFNEPHDPRFGNPGDPRFTHQHDPRFNDPRLGGPDGARFRNPRDPRFGGPQREFGWGPRDNGGGWPPAQGRPPDELPVWNTDPPEPPAAEVRRPPARSALGLPRDPRPPATPATPPFAPLAAAATALLGLWALARRPESEALTVAPPPRPGASQDPVTLQRAEGYIASGEHSRAVPLLQALHDADPTISRRARLQLARCFLETGHPDVAAEEIAGLGLFDIPLDLIYTVAIKLEEAGHKDPSRNLFRAIYRRNVNFRDVRERIRPGAVTVAVEATPIALLPAALDPSRFRAAFDQMDAAYTRTLHSLKASLGIYRRCEKDPEKVFQYLLNPTVLPDILLRIREMEEGPVAALTQMQSIGHAELDRVGGQLTNFDWAGLRRKLENLATSGGKPASHRAAWEELRDLHKEFHALCDPLAQFLTRHRVRISPAIQETIASHPFRDRIHAEQLGEGAARTPDPDQFLADLRVIIENLVNNALEAQAGMVCLRLDCPGPWVVMTVDDDGAGIAADRIPQLFDAGITTKTMGNGTGLTRIKAIVSAYRGSIEVTSKLGEGSTFTVKLPV